MRHIKSLVKGILWEAIGVATALVAVWLFVDSRGSAFYMVLLLPIARVVTWYPYERLFKRGWRRFEAWFNRKEAENADTEAS